MGKTRDLFKKIRDTKGTFHAKMGTIKDRNGLGVQNEAGQRLIQFCQENALVIANTLFQQHKRRPYFLAQPWGGSFLRQGIISRSKSEVGNRSGTGVGAYPGPPASLWHNRPEV